MLQGLSISILGQYDDKGHCPPCPVKCSSCSKSRYQVLSGPAAALRIYAKSSPKSTHTPTMNLNFLRARKTFSRSASKTLLDFQRSCQQGEGCMSSSCFSPSVPFSVTVLNSKADRTKKRRMSPRVGQKLGDFFPT